MCKYKKNFINGISSAPFYNNIKNKNLEVNDNFEEEFTYTYKDMYFYPLFKYLKNKFNNSCYKENSEVKNSKKIDTLFDLFNYIKRSLAL